MLNEIVDMRPARVVECRMIRPQALRARGQPVLAAASVRGAPTTAGNRAGQNRFRHQIGACHCFSAAQDDRHKWHECVIISLFATVHFHPDLPVAPNYPQNHTLPQPFWLLRRLGRTSMVCLRMDVPSHCWSCRRQTCGSEKIFLVFVEMAQ